MASLPKPIPFVGTSRQRDTSGTEDERFVNVMFERVVNEPLREHSINCVKRPGLENFSQPSGGAATGRGSYAWGATGKVYSVFNNRIYSNVTAIGATLAGSSGMCSFVETPQSSSARLLIVSDGTDNYNINTLDSVVQVDESDDSDYPVPNIGSIVYLDGYTFLGQSNGKLYNFDLNSYTAIGASSFLSVDTHGGSLVAFHIQKDQIIAFTTNRTEFFFNNGNPSGSPLLRIDQNTLYLGCPSRTTIASCGEVLCFVSDNPSDGGGARAIYSVTSLGSVKEISTPVINRFLNTEDSGIGNARAWMANISGQLLYGINLATANRTFVYSFNTGLWSEFADSNGDHFNIVSMTSSAGNIFAQHATNGRIYKLIPTVYQDGGANFTVTLQTPRSNFGFHGRKQEASIAIMGDTTTGNLAVSVSDDDFGTFGTARNIDMSKKEKKIYRVGGAFYDRSHKFTYADNYALRLQAWIPDIRV